MFHFLLAFALNVSAAIPIEGKSVLDGKMFTTSVTENVLVVAFLSARCPCSDSHIQELSALTKDYPNVKFIGIHSNPDESPEMTKIYFEKVNLPFPVIQDESTQLADRFKAFKTPHTYVMNSNGEVLYQGGVSSSKTFAKADKKFLRDALEDIKSGRPIAIPEGRTLGCVISRTKHAW